MATTYYGLYQFPSSVSLPVNTELADATVAGAVWKVALDRAVFAAANTTDKAMVRVRGGRKDLVLEPFVGLLIFKAGTLEPVTLSLAAQTTITPGGLVANTWYYLYAYDNGGVVGFEVSTTAPGAHSLWKNADLSRRYLCAFRCDASVRIRPFSHVGGQTAYLWDKVHQDLAITVTPPAAYSLAALVPPTSRLAQLYTLSLDATKVALVPGGHPGLARYEGSLPNSGGTDHGAFWVPLSDTQTLAALMPSTVIGGVEYGAAGAGVTVAHVNAGAGQVLGASVAMSAITVNLGTDGGGAVTSTREQVADAVAESAAAAALLCGVGSTSPAAAATAAGATAVGWPGASSTPIVAVLGYRE